MSPPQGKSFHASLTESYCARIKPVKGMIVDYYDTRQANLSLRTTPPSKVHRNGLRVWRFGFRHNGNAGVITIGRYPAWTADEALRKARKIQVMIDEGQDPREILRPHREPMSASPAPAPVDTVKAMFERYGPTLDQRSNRHRLAVTSYFDRFILSEWGGRDIHTVTRREIVDLVGTVKTKSGPIAANRCATAISAFFSFLLKDGVIANSPAAALPKTEERPREQALTVSQLVTVWQAADQLGGPPGKFTQLLIATAARRDEVAKLPRSEVDIDKREWLLPAVRNKSGRDHLVPLSPLAMGVLEACPNTGLYFFSSSGKNPLGGFDHVKKKLDAAIGELQQPGQEPLPAWTFHDLRRSVRTALSGLKVAPLIAEKILNHSAEKLTRTYDRYSYAPEKRAALELWSAHFTAALAGAPEAAPDFEAAA